ncbi:MAG: MBL fold metallo-hydrolase [Planctomycetota bacterium]
MRITMHGAAGDVTGSAYLIETDSARVMLDYGLFQGGKKEERQNRRRPMFDEKSIDAVVITHAHLDHTGRLPMLTKRGFRGPVFATSATVDLMGILLRDSAFIQQMDAERAARKHGGHVPEDDRPLYNPEHVEHTMTLCRRVEYDERVEVAQGISARWVDAGHILGSASVELTIEEGGTTKTIVFSGDIGPRDVPLLRDPTLLESADLVFLESTYGDRDHRSVEGSIEQLAEVIKQAQTPEGRVLIPSFAVGRTQRLVYELGELMRAGKIPETEVVVDSPMATRTTELYRRNRPLFDEEAWEIIDSGRYPLEFDSLRFTLDAEESKGLNRAGGGLVIISASGMCTGGRIRHHLRHGLPKPETHVVFVGFQARGTLGRLLVDGKKQIKMFGRELDVEAQIHTLGGFSAHAGQTELVEWMTKLSEHRPRIVLTHGENGPRKELAKKLDQRWRLKAAMPELGEIVEL